MAINFLKQAAAKGIQALSKHLSDELSSKPSVLWLVSGGSNVAISATVMESLRADLSQRLDIMLVDERFGPPGHKDSNWQQLVEAGFDSKEARVWPILKPGQDFKSATDSFESLARGRIESASIIIGQLGIGPDGHTAGLLPGCPDEKDSYAIGYEAPPLRRISLSFKALRQIEAAYVFAYGDNKREALTNLKTKQLALEVQPAQILRDIEQVYIYNDQV